MSGNGRPIGIRRSMKPMRRWPAASRKILVVDPKPRATTRVSRISGFLARCLRAARISALPTIAAAIVRPRVMPSRSTLRQAMLAAEGMLFTDYYAEASCTAGRANFITGELPIRTGMTTVGQAGAPTGIPAQAVTIATALKGMGYATGQFGKNHLGDKNEFLPTAHGFDEFFGYLYHLDAMEDPAHPGYPQELLNTVGPRNMVHCYPTNADAATSDPRSAKATKPPLQNAGPLYPKRYVS